MASGVDMSDTTRRWSSGGAEAEARGIRSPSRYADPEARGMRSPSRYALPLSRDEEPPENQRLALNTKAVLDVVDLETERLKLRVAQSLAGLQDEAYRKLKHQLSDDRREYRRSAMLKDERIRALEAQVAAQSAELEAASLKMHGLASKSGARYNALDGLSLCRSTWQQWARHISLARRERRFERLPEAHFRKALGRKVLDAWRTAARSERIGRVDAYWRQQVEEARALAASEAREALESLDAQLAQAHEQVRLGVEQRDALEDELKRAFMRGVCALNMEAVSILRHGTAGARARRAPARPSRDAGGARRGPIGPGPLTSRNARPSHARSPSHPQRPTRATRPAANGRRRRAPSCDHCRCARARGREPPLRGRGSAPPPQCAAHRQ